MEPERYLARVRGEPNLVIEDHGLLILDLQFDYEIDSTTIPGCTFVGGSQGLPLIVEGPDGGKTIKAILQAIGVESLRSAENKSCWVTATFDKILMIEPLHKKDGEPWKYKD